MFDLTGKVALITGASSGIGKGTAIALAKQGAKVAIATRRIDKLNELAITLGAQKHEVMPVKMDVTNKDEITQGVVKIISQWGHLDILVNNAGVVDMTPFLEMSDEKWNRVFDVNVRGYYWVAQAAAREMIKNKWGRIINISSIASGGVGIGFPNITHYSASKGAIVGFTESLADELAPYGILVNCIGPGLIESEMTENITSNPDALKAMTSRLPLKRAGKPEEIASLIVYLASDESSYTTGSTFYVDGGWLAN